jgi:hypothetical protein
MVVELELLELAEAGAVVVAGCKTKGGEKRAQHAQTTTLYYICMYVYPFHYQEE